MVAKIEAGVTNYYHADHLSPRLATNASGNVVGQQGHYPFGEAWYMTNTTTKWQFTGYERDPESGNDYALARYNVNRLGRFSSPDRVAGAIANPQSLNPYAYVVNNPVSLVDPLGLDFGDLPCHPVREDGVSPIICTVTVTATPDPFQDEFFLSRLLQSILRQFGGGDLPLLRLAGTGTGEPDDKIIKTRVQTLRDLLQNDPDCVAFLNSKGGDVEQQLKLAIDHPETVGEAFIPPSGESLTNAETAAVPGQAITINTAGAFFGSSFQGRGLSTDRGRMKGGTEPAQLFILLHEFGHVMDVLLHDKDNQKLVNKNDKLLEGKCKKLIASFPK